MIHVEALQGFDHGGNRTKGSVFQVSESVARGLAAKGLVRYATPRPEEVVGEQSSASPAAQASPVQTAKRSRSGSRKKKVVAS